MLSIAAAFSISSYAQAPQTTQQSTQAPAQDQQGNSTQQGKGNKNSLGLTSDQQQKMHQINADEKAKRQSIQNDKTLSDAQKQDQLKSLKKDSKHQKNSLLTKDQKAKKKQMSAAKHANRKSNSSGSTQQR